MAKTTLTKEVYKASRREAYRRHGHQLGEIFRSMFGKAIYTQVVLPVNKRYFNSPGMYESLTFDERSYFYTNNGKGSLYDTKRIMLVRPSSEERDDVWFYPECSSIITSVERYFPSKAFDFSKPEEIRFKKELTLYPNCGYIPSNEYICQQFAEGHPVKLSLIEILPEEEIRVVYTARDNSEFFRKMYSILLKKAEEYCRLRGIEFIALEVGEWTENRLSNHQYGPVVIKVDMIAHDTLQSGINFIGAHLIFAIDISAEGVSYPGELDIYYDLESICARLRHRTTTA